MPLFVWEHQFVSNILCLIVGVLLTLIDDRWVHNTSGIYSNNLTYWTFSANLPFSMDQLQIISKVWKSVNPEKDIAFSWKLLLDKVPTHQSLMLSSFKKKKKSYVVHLVMSLRLWILPCTFFKRISALHLKIYILTLNH